MASQSPPHLHDCDGLYGPWAAGLGQGDEAAVQQPVTPREGATEYQVDEVYSQLQRTIAALECGYHMVVSGAAGPCVVE